MFVFYFVTILLEDSNCSVNDASFLEQHYLQIILRNMGSGGWDTIFNTSKLCGGGAEYFFMTYGL